MSAFKILFRTVFLLVLFTAACPAPTPEASFLCNVADIKSQLDRMGKEEKRTELRENALTIQDCIKDQEAEIFNYIESLEPTSADEHRYAIASALSDTAHLLYQKKPNERNAKWWSEYITRVSPPYNEERINRAIKDLNSIARLYDFSTYWSALHSAVSKLGKKVRAVNLSEVLATLYRCDRWDKEIDPRVSQAPCVRSCATLLLEFLEETAWASPAPNNSDASRLLDTNRKILQGRLICHSNAQ